MRAGITFVFLAGVITAQTPTPESKGTIHGVVKDTAGTPAAGVAVAVNPMASGPSVIFMPEGRAVATLQHSFSERTDEAGSYSFSGMPPGSYSVAPECASTPKPVKLDAGEEITLEFVCPTNPTISGHVHDHNGDPAVDAFVWLLKSEYQAGMLKQIVIGPKVTAEDGAYSFDTGLEPNRGYYVLVDRDTPEELVAAAAADLKDDRDPIEVPTYYPSSTRMDAATPVILQPGENREQIDIKIATAAFYCVEGKMSASGAPASYNFGIQDRALAGTRLVRLRSSSGDDGKYHVCGLPAGPYRLFTEDALTEFAVARTDMQHVDLSADSAHLRLKLDWEDPPVPKFDATGEAILRKFAALTGLGDAPSDDDLHQFAIRLSRQSPDSQELYNAAIRLSESHEFTDEQIVQFSRQLQSRRDVVNVTLAGATSGLAESLGAPVPSEGPFRNGIPGGDYNLQIQVFSLSSAYAKKVTYNGVELTGDTLRVAPGAEGTVHVVMSQDAATVAAKVTDADAKPVPNATVIVVPDSVTSVAQLSRTAIRGQTDQNGDYTSRPLAPGKYRVLATTQSIRWGVPEDLQKVLLVLFQAKDVELDGKATAQVTLEPVPM